MTLRKYIDTYEWSGLGFAAGVAVIIAVTMLAPHFFASTRTAATATRKPAVLAQATKPAASAAQAPAAAPQQPAPAPAPTPAPEPLSHTELVADGKYAGWNLYTSKRYGIAFNYPASWNLQESESANPTDAESTQLTIDLSITAEDKTIQIMTLTAHNAALTTLETIQDGIVAQHPNDFFKEARVNDYGRETLIYTDHTTLYSNTLYLIGNSDKTYGVHDKNALHYGDPGGDTYQNDFERLYESIVL